MIGADLADKKMLGFVAPMKCFAQTFVSLQKLPLIPRPAHFVAGISFGPLGGFCPQTLCQLVFFSFVISLYPWVHYPPPEWGEHCQDDHCGVAGR